MRTDHVRATIRSVQTRVICCWLAVLSASLLPSVASHAGDIPPAPLQPDVIGGYDSSRVVIKVTPTGGFRAGVRTELDALLDQWGAIDVRPAYRHAFRSRAVAARFGLDRTYVVELPPGTDIPALIDACHALRAEVEFAELDVIGGVADTIPNDPDFSLMYGLHNTGQTGGVEDADIDAPAAWDLHTGDYGTVTIAIIDSGVDPHPEFADRIVPGTNTNDPNSPDLTEDGCPHGTHVAGIAAAAGNNGIGMAGVTWGALIMPVRVLNGCSGTQQQCADGIVWATDHGADICSMSLQYYTYSQALEDAVNYAHSLGVVVVAAAGNNAGNTIAYPAKFANCVAVGATTDRDTWALFSNYGPEIDVAAPGDNIWSTWTNNGYIYSDGTSMATPHVSGLAALVKSYNPGLTNEEIITIITGTADDRGDPGWDEKFGYGRINAQAALAAATPPIQIVSSEPPAEAIDARQPFDPDGTDATGWSEITLTFDGDTAELVPSDFLVSQEGGVQAPPEVASVVSTGATAALVTLTAAVEVGAWTTVTHLASGTSVRVGYLPGDVNGDGTSAAADVLTLIDVLNDVVSRPLHATDIDRTGFANPADLLREVDLLNGAGAYAPMLGVSLP